MMDPKYESLVNNETRANASSDTQKHWNQDDENANIQNYPFSFASDAQRAGESITPNAHPRPRVHRSYPTRVRHVSMHPNPSHPTPVVDIHVGIDSVDPD